MNGSHILLDRDAALAPGDGLAFPGPSGRIVGTLVNAADGGRIDVQSPSAIKGINIGAEAYRSFDHAWHRQLRAALVERRIGVRAQLDFPSGLARLRLFDEDGFESKALGKEKCPPPEKERAFLAGAMDSLSRLGGTPFELTECQIDPSGFLPISKLNALRRLAVELLLQKRVSSRAPSDRKIEAPPRPLPAKHLGHEWNVSNSLARAFYTRFGASSIEDALELSAAFAGKPLMSTRLCIRFELGWCDRHKNEMPTKTAAVPKGPLYLENGPIALRCEFDCEKCVMKLYL
jgi:putative protease